MSNRHVIYFHPGAELYGSDRMALATVDALVRSDMAVTAVLPVTGPLDVKLAATGARVIDREFPVLRKATMRPAALVRLLLSLPRVLVRACRLVRLSGADLVYVNTITQPWFVIAGRLAGTPVIAHVRESESGIPDLVKRILLLPLALASHVVCNSRSTEEYVLRYGTRVAGKTSVLYNGKDWSHYFRRSFSDVAERPTIAFVGRPSPRKGPDIAVSALAILVEQGVDARLVMAGSVFPGYEWYEDELRQLAEDLGVADRCEFRGLVTDTSAVLGEADIVVVPSMVEPFGTVAAEAMAAERPTVVSDVQGLVEIVTDESVGLTFPAGDAPALAAACLRVLREPGLARSVATAGRASVEERFSLEKYATRTVELVDRWMGQKA